MLNLLRSWPYATPLLVLVIGLSVTAFVVFQLWRLIDAQDMTRFERQVGQSLGVIEDRLNTHIAILEGTSGLFVATPEVTQEQFRRYVRLLNLEERYRGLQGVGWSVRLAPRDLDAFEREQRRTWGDEFRVWPGTPRAEYHAITFLDPLDERNRAALGYDMSTEAVRRSAMTHARDTGEAALSGRVNLTPGHDGEGPEGFLFFVPVYHGGTVPRTVEGRRDALRGFVFSPFRAGDFLRGILRAAPSPSLHIRIYDGAPVPSGLLFDTAAELGETNREPRFSRIEVLEVAGRPWTVEFATLPGFDMGSRAALLPLAAVLGILISLICAVMTWDQVRARLIAQREIRERERAERQRSVLIDELNHRVKNTLATVQSIARQTLKSTPKPDAFATALEGRLMALANTHELLTAANWEGTTLRQVIEAELAPHGCLGTERCRLDGPRVALRPRTALSLGMAMHELATNAAKYGALLGPEGRVAVKWKLSGAGGDRVLEIVWQEAGGPAVTPPTRTGFGSVLLQQGIAYEIRGDVKLAFERDGVVCRITIPMPDQAPGSLPGNSLPRA